MVRSPNNNTLKIPLHVKSRIGDKCRVLLDHPGLSLVCPLICVTPVESQSIVVLVPPTPPTYTHRHTRTAQVHTHTHTTHTYARMFSEVYIRRQLSVPRIRNKVLRYLVEVCSPATWVPEDIGHKGFSKVVLSLRSVRRETGFKSRALGSGWRA